jgi:hypothetical protein
MTNKIQLWSISAKSSQSLTLMLIPLNMQSFMEQINMILKKNKMEAGNISGPWPAASHTTFFSLNVHIQKFQQ